MDYYICNNFFGGSFLAIFWAIFWAASIVEQVVSMTFILAWGSCNICACISQEMSSPLITETFS